MLNVINDKDFIDDYQNNIEVLKKPCVILFSASWCAACKSFIPMVENLSNEYDIIFLLNKIDDGIKLANRYKVKSLPAFVTYKNGIVNEIYIGSISEESFRNKLNILLK